MAVASKPVEMTSGRKTLSEWTRALTVLRLQILVRIPQSVGVQRSTARVTRGRTVSVASNSISGSVALEQQPRCGTTYTAVAAFQTHRAGLTWLQHAMERTTARIRRRADVRCFLTGWQIWRLVTHRTRSSNLALMLSPSRRRASTGSTTCFHRIDDVLPPGRRSTFHRVQTSARSEAV